MNNINNARDGRGGEKAKNDVVFSMFGLGVSTLFLAFGSLNLLFVWLDL